MPITLQPTYAQIAALTRQMEDAVGRNKDGVPNDETLPPDLAGPTRWVDRNPIATLVRDTFSSRGDGAALASFVEAKRAQWGQISNLPPDRLASMSPLFEPEKAIALTRFGRTPAEVTDGFVRAKGSVDGQAIADRDIFWQRWRPTAPPSGKVVVVAPGYQQTGRNFLEQVQLLNRAGHDVLVMDQQWAGHSDGKPGAIDRGFGITRDVAAVAAAAAEVAEGDYGASGEVVLLGTSMGGGAGALGAVAMNDAGLIQLSGKQMPKGVSAVLQAPFLEASDNALNRLFQGLSAIPGVRNLALPPTGKPMFTEDPVALAKLATHQTAEHIVGRAQALTASDSDLGRLQEVIASRPPLGRVYIIHSEADPLASSTASAAMVEKLAPKAKLRLLPGANHLHEESAAQQGEALAGIDWVTG